MILHKTILLLIFTLKLTSAEELVCDNKECKHPDLITMDSLLSELNTIKEGNRNTTTFLKELNERIDQKIAVFTAEIESIKNILNEKVNQLTTPTDARKKNDSVKAHPEFDYSLFDNLWIVVQRRQDGSEDFYRNWTDYKQGFGNQFGEFFVGLEKIYDLTNYKDHELLILLEDFVGIMKYAHYDHFLIGNETERYRLKKLGKYSGSAGDYLKLHLNMFFSTKDRDNDDADNGNCAEWFKGAWWYYHCLTSNLNGPYRYNRHLKDNERGIGITWGSYDEIQYSYKTAQMMIRRKKKKDI